MRRFWLIVCSALTLSGPVTAAPGATTVGILPFDVATGEATASASQSLAKLVRIEMMKKGELQPVLIDVPASERLPLSAEQAAELGKSAQVSVIVAGTVLEATTSHASNGAMVPSGLGIGVGGSVSRTKAHVVLHVELVDPASGKVIDTFDVKGEKTGTGVGADLSTALGTFNMGDNGWEKTPMGQALREAAQKLSKEVADRRKQLK